MKLDCFLTEPHYWNHLGPVWDELSPEVRGTVIGSHSVLESIGKQGSRGQPRGDGNAILVASGGDARQVPPQRQLFHLQHGAAQSYGGAGVPEAAWGYAGGPNLDHVDTFLCVNDTERALWHRRYPDAEALVVGAPCMDEWHGQRLPVLDFLHEKPTVAISFHWRCNACAESRPAYQEWRRALADLAARDLPYRILGHEHPRWHNQLLHWWRSIGVPVTNDWPTVMRTASLYLVDNSSTMYEFAATDRPVVGLLSRHWRREVEHGLRFWQYAPPMDLDPRVGADGLDATIRSALTAPNVVCPQGWRERASHAAYGELDGKAAHRAARAIEERL